MRGPNEPEIGQWINRENFIKYDAWKKSIENSGMPNEGTWFTDKEIELAALCFDMTIVCFSITNIGPRFDCEFSARTQMGDAMERLHLYHHKNHFSLLVHPEQTQLREFFDDKGVVLMKFNYDEFEKTTKVK